MKNTVLLKWMLGSLCLIIISCGQTNNDKSEELPDPTSRTSDPTTPLSPSPETEGSNEEASPNEIVDEKQPSKSVAEPFTEQEPLIPQADEADEKSDTETHYTESQLEPELEFEPQPPTQSLSEIDSCKEGFERPRSPDVSTCYRTFNKLRRWSLSREGMINQAHSLCESNQMKLVTWRRRGVTVWSTKRIQAFCE